MSTVPIQQKGFTNLDYKLILFNNIQKLKLNYEPKQEDLFHFLAVERLLSIYHSGVLNKYGTILRTTSVKFYALFLRPLQTKRKRVWSIGSGHRKGSFSNCAQIYWPVAKKIGRELIAQAAPELLDVVTKKQSAKQALRNTVTKTARKQLDGARFSKRKRANQTKPTISRKHITRHL